jgi:hypothetical protein
MLTLKHQKKAQGISVELPAQPPGYHIAGQAVAVLVPVTAAKIALEPVKIDLMCGGVLLEGRRQEQNGYALLLTEFFQLAVRIK